MSEGRDYGWHHWCEACGTVKTRARICTTCEVLERQAADYEKKLSALREERDAARTALALANVMIESGERHSPQSKAVINKALGVE